MNPILTRIQEQLLNSQLIETEKQALLKLLADADKQWTITDFKLDRTEKVKKTTAILLEETIEELEKKRQAVEAQNRELEIEKALEKVRAVAMGMNKPDNLVDICEILFNEFRSLGFDVLRNAMINIHDDEHSSFVNYDYSDEIGKSITPLVYDIHPVIEKQIREIRSADDAFSETVFAGKDLEEWKKFRKERGEKDDPRIDDVVGLHYYFYSIGNGSIGISSFAPIDGEKRALLKRFRNVFILAYQRYTDIAQAAAQAREAQIEAALERVRSRTMAMHKTEELLPAAELVAKELSALGVSSMNVSYAFVDKGEKSASYYSVNPVDGKVLPFPFIFPHTDTEVMRSILSSWKKQEPFYVLDLDEEGTVRHQTWVGEHIQKLMIENGIPFSVEEFLNISPKTAVIYSFNFAQGYLFNIGEDRLTTAQEEMVLRFIKVFEMTYRRFLDLHKAEAQAREAQIEAALERVRSRSMAMHKSSELGEVALVLFQQLRQLGGNLWSTGVGLCKEDRDVDEFWMATEGGMQNVMLIPHTEDSVHRAMYEGWKNGDDIISIAKGGEELKLHYDYMLMLPSIGPIFEAMVASGFDLPTWQTWHAAYFSYGYLLIITLEPYEERYIFKRFAKVFEQAYTRFLDLQKAEAQARESQIQLAMERVRARTMAMQHSDELPEAAQLLFQQVESLGIPLWSTGYCIWEEDKKAVIAWMSSKGVLLPSFRAPLTEEATFIHMREAWERGESFFVDEISGEAIKTHYEYMATVPSMAKIFKPVLESGFQLPTFQINHIAYYSQGFLSFITYERVPQAHDIFKRFAKVFEQTYTRFLDLQKAEAQAREAKVEAALERVRSRTMAMQQSSELADVATVLFQQVKALGVSQWTCGFNIWELGDKEFTFYPGSPDGDILPPCKVPLTEDPTFMSFDESRRRGDELFVYEKTGERQKEHYKYMLALPGGMGDLLQGMLDNGFTFPEFQIDHVANFSHGNLLFITYEHFPEMHDIFKRFAKVFDQTYTRFLDLQRAEAQAREAQIESALEKVRSRTMAMQHSDELGDAALLLFNQVKLLGGKLFGCGFNIWDEDRKYATAWMAGEDRIQPPFKTSSSEDVFKRIFEAELKGERLFVEEMSGEVNQTHYRYMLSIPDFKKIVEHFSFSIPEFQIMHCAFFSQGYLMFISFEPVPEVHDLFMRFAKVFEQTYTRFLDLKKAEALAKEALKQASLDRIRGQVASMRSAEDLEHIIPMLWHELGMLDVPFIRCGVFIMNEADSIVNVYLSSPDGKSLGLLHLPFNAGGVTQNAVDHWRKKKVYKEHWNKEEFIAWMQTLIASGQVHDSVTYQGAAAPPESLFLHFVPFKQGMLYVGSTEMLHQDIIELLKTLANTFSIAYSRYEDFRLLEEAKNRIETTLVELKATQSQLVQSEKMASLGELTAGIAHEIQNPLNFVNNFSELSNELIEEMEQEMEKGNKEEAKAIISDIRSNLEKINQHGRRADSIVKGMLQHSRASTGEKEPTDINALADEYLRLAYHGFRAKDKSFNAILETDLDQSIGKIKAVPQELGRVLLNLYNNAFYAVNEKSGTLGYDPKVRLSTTKHGNSILIAVQDNGKGIPEKVKEKIFQPFFTTKPTGQGTGLGLSLSYDIVKAHGGEFRVDSTEGEGTSFIIQLPV